MVDAAHSLSLDTGDRMGLATHSATIKANQNSNYTATMHVTVQLCKTGAKV